MKTLFLNRWAANLLLLAWVCIGNSETCASDPRLQSFVTQHCVDCHNAETKEGNLDLTTLPSDLSRSDVFELWVKLHDRVRDGEMPPPSETRPTQSDLQSFLNPLAQLLIAKDDEVTGKEGRATRRRMNRYEYEQTLRDLFQAPWLQIKEMLPEDGVAYRFNKVGDALDVSHVQIARYMAAAEYAMREVMADVRDAPKSQTTRYYARDCKAFSRKVYYSAFNKSPERATFPIVGFEADIDVLEEKAPMTVGKKDPERRKIEALGVVASTYEPLEIKFDAFKAPRSGKYRLRFSAFSFWAGPESKEKWWRPSRTEVSRGQTREPVSVYAESPPRLLRKLGNFEVNPEPNAYELEVYLREGETIRPDAVRLFRSRPPGPYRNPLATPEGQPGVAFRWLEVEGPVIDGWPLEGHKLLFDELPLDLEKNSVKVVPGQPSVDAKRLLERFMDRVYRSPAREEDLSRFLAIIEHARSSGNSFEDAMLAGYSAILCSPRFVMLEDAPGPLTDRALATRLAYFLWNTEPDETLRKLADQGVLDKPEVLREQTKRMLEDPKSKRMVNAFLDYWLDLRKTDATSADAGLYPDYYLDDYLVESSVEETQLFFEMLVRHNLPARLLIDSDFVVINERLALHYGIPDVQGTEFRRVPLPNDSVRGGLLTQASVLKVTANGTTTSPVVRGVWMTERILGKPIPPPPAAVPAVEPDTRGATTIREQLEKHRTLENCRACHARIDPPGFALENFDVLGGWRTQYRAMIELDPQVKKKMNARGYGKNGQPFEFDDGPQVDAAGALPDGRSFKDIQEMKSLLVKDQRQIARNLAAQFVVYATGAPVRFGDRPELEALLDHCQSSDFGIQDIIIELVQSELFRNK